MIPKKPFTRTEMYLDHIARNGGGGGGEGWSTVDPVPTEDSTNPVSSGGVYDALMGKQSQLVFDQTPTEGSTNPVTSDGAYAAIEEAKSHDYIVYAFHIDGSESDPSAKVTYFEDAVGMTPAYMDYTNGVFNYGTWKDAFFMPRPCMLGLDGIVDYYLDPNDYSKKADGSSADTSPAYPGNYMMEWGRDGKQIWYKVVPDDGDITSGTVYIANWQADPSYRAWSFINNQGELVDHFYTAIYNGSTMTVAPIAGDDYIMRSLPNMIVSQSLTGTKEIARCLANNQDDDVLWYTEVLADRILINFLLILIGKSTDTQTVFGNGLITGSQQALIDYRTGALNNKGLFFGYNDQTHAVKVFGMENYWGAQWRRTTGYISDNGSQKIKLTYCRQDGSSADGYSTNGSGYISMGITPTGESVGAPIAQMNFNEYGMFGKHSLGGSSSTYFCDGQWFNNSLVAYSLFGGSSLNELNCGAFCCHIGSIVSNAAWNIGVALSCRPKKQ